jgi:hypothetical protein
MASSEKMKETASFSDPKVTSTSNSNYSSLWGRFHVIH